MNWKYIFIVEGEMVPRFRPLIKLSYLGTIFGLSEKKTNQCFEESLSVRTKFKYVTTFSYGRSALWAALKFKNIQHSEIICQNYTCMVVANAIEDTGNHCVFVDINLHDLQYDHDLLIQSITDQTYGIVFTELFGVPINLEQIKTIKHRWPHVKIILDITHSFNRNLNDELLNIVDFAFCGFGLSKPIVCGFGGALLTNDKTLYDTVLENKKNILKFNYFREYAMRLYLFCSYIAFLPFFYCITYFLQEYKLLDRFTVLFDLKSKKMPDDFLEEMSNFEKKIGVQSLESFDENFERILSVKRKISNALEGGDGEILVREYPSTFFLNYYVEDRDKFLLFFKSRKVELGTLYDYSLNSLLPYRKNKYFNKNDNADKVAKGIVNFPLNINFAEVEKILSAIAEFKEAKNQS